MNSKTSEALATQLKVLADPKRLRIVDLLMEGVQCNCELGDQLDMPKNLISHHLRVLREAGLVDVERDTEDARWVYYSLNRRALTELIAVFGGFLDPERIRSRHPQCGPKFRAEPAADWAFTNG
ncbi:MAG: winged helix-turn-helix transcriptional regulator [Caldilineales bacterium]|nr:winged helix-turn-helix transcriptional regulator [Caldilineales bacterium]